jgi:hypothetical protein
MSKKTQELIRAADKAWNRILGSPLAMVYLRELYLLSVEIVEEIDGALALLPEESSISVGTLTVNHDIHRRLVRALGAAGRIRALCLERGQGSKQTALEHKVSIRRAVWLTGVLEGIDLVPFQEAQVRNTLEHFDEYLDKASVDAQSGAIQMPVIIPVDISLSHRRLLEQFQIGGQRPSCYFVRAYIGNEGIFVNCGHEVNIVQLRKSSVEVRDRLAGIVSLLDDQAEGSPVVVLTEGTFGSDSATPEAST